MKPVSTKRMAGRLTVALVLLCLVGLIVPGSLLAQTPPPEKRTLFVIGNLNGALNFPMMAYVIVDDSLYTAARWNAVTHEYGPVGLAVDETNENVFVSYEMYDAIEVFDARDATPLGTIFLYGTSDLAGMRVHQGRGQLYVVDRDMSDIFIFDTTTFDTVDHWNLPGGVGAWGIDIMEDEGWLFVTDMTETVRYYDIDSHAEVGSFDLTYPVTAIAVTNYPEQLVYTQGHDGYSGMHPYFIKYEMDSGLESFVLTGSNPKGVSLNPATGYAYSVVDSKVNVIDTETMSIASSIGMNWTWCPTDCLATFIPFGGTVKKTCLTHPNGKIYKGDTVTFNIAIQNRDNYPIHVLPLTDIYDNTQLSFVSADPATDDNNDDGQLDWSDVIASLGQDLPTGEWANIEVTFIATEDCEDQLSGVNTANMHDVEDTEGVALPDASGQFDYIINCKCRTNADCDDGLFCNGQEVCQADGTCTSPGNPCPLDDGLWCNGTETEECDEELDECGHENEPCADDGVFCNGQEVCNENTDTCTNSGPPCSDDGQFCNGEESCDEDEGACVSSGNPCSPGEECNEVDDSCGEVDVADDDDTPEEEEEDEDLWPEGKVTGGCCGCD